MAENSVHEQHYTERHQSDLNCPEQFLSQKYKCLLVILMIPSQIRPRRVLLLPRQGGQRGDGAAPDPVAARDRLHLHHLVQARSLQLGQHREGEALPLLVNTSVNSKPEIISFSVSKRAKAWATPPISSVTAWC